ncbi:MAG: hypothetical protein R2724_33140 [Bryobacterales bacterium]
MPDCIVHCAKLHQDLPGLQSRPSIIPWVRGSTTRCPNGPGTCGKGTSKMIINEFRLNPATMEAQEMILKQMGVFLRRRRETPAALHTPPSA